LDKFLTCDWNSTDWEKLSKLRLCEGWTARPDRERFVVVRMTVCRFSDGSTMRFYQQIARPETRREWSELRERARQLLDECNAELTRDIVHSERKFIKTPTPAKQRGRRKD